MRWHKIASPEPNGVEWDKDVWSKVCAPFTPAQNLTRIVLWIKCDLNSGFLLKTAIFVFAGEFKASQFSNPGESKHFLNWTDSSLILTLENWNSHDFWGWVASTNCGVLRLTIWPTQEKLEPHQRCWCPVAPAHLPGTVGYMYCKQDLFKTFWFPRKKLH